MYRPAARSSASIGGFVSSLLTFSIAPFSVSERDGNDMGYSFYSFLFHGAATAEKLGKRRRKTLQRLKKDPSFV